MKSDSAAMNTRLDRMEADLTGKIDLILRHVTGQADREYTRSTINTIVGVAYRR